MTMGEPRQALRALYYSGMRRRPWLRALIGTWGLWFTSSLSTPIGLHSCPAHGGHTAQPSIAHHSHAASHSDSGNHSHKPTSPKRDNCTCLGWCCCVASLAAPDRATELPAAAIESSSSPQYPTAAQPRVRWAHALPFANGPPAI